MTPDRSDPGAATAARAFIDNPRIRVTGFEAELEQRRAFLRGEAMAACERQKESAGEEAQVWVTFHKLLH